MKQGERCVRRRAVELHSRRVKTVFRWLIEVCDNHLSHFAYNFNCLTRSRRQSIGMDSEFNAFVGA